MLPDSKPGKGNDQPKTLLSGVHINSLLISKDNIPVFFRLEKAIAEFGFENDGNSNKEILAIKYSLKHTQNIKS